MRIVSFILDSAVIRKILDHLADPDVQGQVGCSLHRDRPVRSDLPDVGVELCRCSKAFPGTQLPLPSGPVLALETVQLLPGPLRDRRFEIAHPDECIGRTPLSSGLADADPPRHTALLHFPSMTDGTSSTDSRSPDGGQTADPEAEDGPAKEPTRGTTAETETENPDLGFGSVVARESRQRLLNRDGSFNVRREGLSPLGSMSLYIWLVNLTWPRFLAIAAGGYLALNVLFAFAYLSLGPDALAGTSATAFGERLLETFFFSVQSSSTIGYGAIAPASLGADLLVTLETILSFLAFALLTGVTFARFSRPTARIVASRQAVVAPYRGRTALMFRIVNARSNEIMDLRARVVLVLHDSDGGRTFHPLPLERDRVQFFPLAWTVVHPIDDDSPLAGMGPADLRAADPELLVLLTGYDETFAGTVHTRTSYQATEVVWGARFVDLFDHSRSGSGLSIDVTKLHETEPASLPRSPGSDRIDALG